MKEAELQSAVVELAGYLGYKRVCFRPARTELGWRTAVQGDVGFPDMVAARMGRLVVVEFKSAIGRLTKEQNEWLLRFASCGAETYVWRPKDWLDGTIDLVLRRKA